MGEGGRREGGGREGWSVGKGVERGPREDGEMGKDGKARKGEMQGVGGGRGESGGGGP